MNSKIKILTKSELQALPTHRLLAYLKKLNTCHTTPDWEIRSAKSELTKESEAWKNLHAMVKEILATRPHVKKKKARKQK